MWETWANDHVIVWDLETVPDLAAAARIHGLPEDDLDGARVAVGDKFPKLPLHSIVCIGALIAERSGEAYLVRSLGAPNVGDRSEAALIQSFVDRIAELRPRLVGFNCASFDLAVLRYRAMVNFVSAPGLNLKGYYKRYAEDSLDLCDVLASFDNRGKMSLNDLCRVLDLPGKPDDIDGSEVAAYVAVGRLAEVAGYAETDVVSTYRVWLRHELFRGALTPNGFEQSEANLLGYVREKLLAKPHLGFLLGMQSAIGVLSANETLAQQRAAE